MATVTKILFVCLGNICRSPAAQAVFQYNIDQARLYQQFKLDSAGTANYHEGELPDARMRLHGAKRGYNLYSRARQLKAEDGDDFDVIITMDDSNYANVQRIFTAKQMKKVHKMCDYTELDFSEVPDPYYEGEEGFEQVFDLLEDACLGLQKSLLKKPS